jgi:ABC transporter/Bacterial extracellular solute-binding protein
VVLSHRSSDESAVNLRSVSKRYGNRRAVSDLTLDVESGEFLAILGPSGSGKTTTMRIIAGFDRPDTGEVFIDGKEVTHLPAERRNVNTVFQSYALFPHMSVLENVTYGPRMHGYSRQARHAKAYELLSLDPNLMNRVYDRNNKYSIPKDWGLLGVLYNPEAVKDEIHTWEDFFKAGERPGVSGKVHLSVSGWETISPELWLQGKDWNTVGEADIRAAGRRLTRFARHVRTFSGLDPNSVANGSLVLAQTYQSAARAAITLNPKLKWVVPGPSASFGSTTMR